MPSDKDQGVFSSDETAQDNIGNVADTPQDSVSEVVEDQGPDESKQRVGIFVDVQNMYYSARNLKRSKINYEGLMDFLLNGRHLIRAVAYLLNKEDVDQKSFIGALRNIGYDVRVKTLKPISEGVVKGDWKVELPLEILTIAPRLDVAVLVTGNGDYAPLLEYLKRLGVKVEIAGFDKNTSMELIRLADEFITLGDDVLIPEKKFEERARGAQVTSTGPASTVESASKPE